MCLSSFSLSVCLSVCLSVHRLMCLLWLLWTYCLSYHQTLLTTLSDCHYWQKHSQLLRTWWRSQQNLLRWLDSRIPCTDNNWHCFRYLLMWLKMSLTRYNGLSVYWQVSSINNCSSFPSTVSLILFVYTLSHLRLVVWMVLISSRSWMT